MDGLSAKVFRTFNASVTLEKELYTMTPANRISGDSTIDEKVAFYNRANKEVAILCNHQRTVSKAQETGIKKMIEKKDQAIAKNKWLENEFDKIKSKPLRHNKKGFFPDLSIENDASDEKISQECQTAMIVEKEMKEG